MHIGLTYDLRDEYLVAGYSDEETAEFDRPDTIDAIEDALLVLGHETQRIGHARQLVQRLAAGERWDLVFNICEGMYGPGREAQVPALLDVYELPYTFSDPCVMSLCLDKGITKCMMQNAGIPTARFAVVHHVAELSAMPRLKYPLFAKPIAEGTGKGITTASRVFNRRALAQVCRQLVDRYRQPVLVEEFLPGREFTVGMLGTGSQAICLGTLEIVLRADAEPDIYSYANKEHCEELVEYRLVTADEDPQVARAEQLALAAWKLLNCRDAGRIDLRCSAAGEPLFLEANPLAGLHPSHSDLPMLATAVGMSYLELIRRIVSSALQRGVTSSGILSQPDTSLACLTAGVFGERAR